MKMLSRIKEGKENTMMILCVKRKREKSEMREKKKEGHKKTIKGYGG